MQDLHLLESMIPNDLTRIQKTNVLSDPRAQHVRRFFSSFPSRRVPSIGTLPNEDEKRDAIQRNVSTGGDGTIRVHVSDQETAHVPRACVASLFRIGPSSIFVFFIHHQRFHRHRKEDEDRKEKKQQPMSLYGMGLLSSKSNPENVSMGRSQGKRKVGIHRDLNGW